MHGTIMLKSLNIPVHWSTREFLSTGSNNDFSYFSFHCIYIYDKIFTRPNGIFTHLGRVDIDFFYLCSAVK